MQSSNHAILQPLTMQPSIPATIQSFLQIIYAVPFLTTKYGADFAQFIIC